MMKSSFEYKIDKANNFSKEEIDSFKKIVIDAGEVSKNTFDELLKKEPLLLFIPDTKNITAVGSLKVPNDSYKKKVFANSKSNEISDIFQFELGWIVSLLPGNGKRLVSILSDLAENIYATVRKENHQMKNILERFGFVKSGQSYKSERENYYVELYIKKRDTSNFG